MGGNVPVEMFYGRSEQRARIIDQTGTPLMCGGRQPGKSALLRVAAPRFERTPSWIALYVDVAAAEIGTRRGTPDSSGTCSTRSCGAATSSGRARPAVRLELALMEREGVLGRDGLEYALTPRATGPSQAPDLGALRDCLAATRAERETLIRCHTVVLFLRRLPDGQQASSAKQRDFAREVAAEGLDYHLGERLPPGYAYVSVYEGAIEGAGARIPNPRDTHPPTGPANRHATRGDLHERRVPAGRATGALIRRRF